MLRNFVDDISVIVSFTTKISAPKLVRRLYALSKSNNPSRLNAINDARQNLDSVGGSVECVVTGVPAGVGGALYGGIDGEMAKAIFAIPGVKGIEFGAGFEVSKMYGSQNNDAYFEDEGIIKTRTNNHGGVLGGMTTGMPILFNVAFKPTPSISKSQETINLKTGKSMTLEINGRHDPLIVHRAVPVVEAMAALVVLGHLN